jgi:hypothetical protein
MELKIRTMGYSRVFSMGNYENEKISVEAEVPEQADITEVYIELKKVVENAHNLRNELRNYAHAKEVVNNKKLYRIGEVESAEDTIKAFELKYPNIREVEQQAMLPEVEAF